MLLLNSTLHSKIQSKGEDVQVGSREGRMYAELIPTFMRVERLFSTDPLAD